MNITSRVVPRKQIFEKSLYLICRGRGVDYFVCAAEASVNDVDWASAKYTSFGRRQ